MVKQTRVQVNQAVNRAMVQSDWHPPLSTPDKRDFLRDPYVFDFLNLPHQRLLESDLEQGLLDNLQEFLLELGKGFAFVARQQRIRTE
ncbi:MAG: PDDEXK nuclease domain-containing protein, partial [Desulfococcaceae bacterium]